MRLMFEFLNAERGCQWIEMEDPPQAVIRESIADLPAGSLFLSDGDMWLTELLGILTILMRPILLFRLGMKNRYSHCGMLFGPAGKTVESVPKGILRGQLEDRLVKGSRVTVWTCDRMDEERLAVLEKMADGMVGKKYDWLKLLSFAVPIEEDDNAYICSEAVGTAYALIDLLPHKSIDWDPSDLADFLNTNGHEWGWRKTLVWM